MADSIAELKVDCLPELSEEQSELFCALLRRESELTALRLQFKKLDEVHMRECHEFRKGLKKDERQFVFFEGRKAYIGGLKGTFEEDDYQALACQLPRTDRLTAAEAARISFS